VTDLLKLLVKAVRDEVFVKLLTAIACQYLLFSLLTIFSFRRKHHIYLKSVTTTRILDGDGDSLFIHCSSLFIFFLVISGLKSKLFFVCYPFPQMCVNHEFFAVPAMPIFQHLIMIVRYML
jgi:hypothetical protein